MRCTMGTGRNHFRFESGSRIAVLKVHQSEVLFQQQNIHFK